MRKFKSFEVKYTVEDKEKIVTVNAGGKDKAKEVAEKKLKASCKGKEFKILSINQIIDRENFE